MAFPANSMWLDRMARFEEFRSRSPYKHDALVDAFEEEELEIAEKERNKPYPGCPDNPGMRYYKWRFEGYGVVCRTFDESWHDHDRAGRDWSRQQKLLNLISYKKDM